MPNKYDIKNLGGAKHKSALPATSFVKDDRRILVDPSLPQKGKGAPASLEQAGPRAKLFFEAAASRIGIVSCGGLCPGINDVIRGIVMVAWHRYGVRDILGFRYGYQGLIGNRAAIPTPLTPQIVENIHKAGGTMLGTSRGKQNPKSQVDYLVEKKIDMLFAIGGDGTQRGVMDISREIKKRSLPIAIIGIPKTIDNDILYTERSFGFETAVAAAQAAIGGAHREARAVRNGVGLVKLMGRESGFVAVQASLASSDVNLVLIPEVKFSVERLLAWLEERLRRKAHAVIVVAEGAGQDLVPAASTDESGNRRPGDIGEHLKEMMQTLATVKYIDPSYIIRSQPANADDSAYCFLLAENAAHAAMSGRTAMVVTLCNGHFVHVPSELVAKGRRKVDPRGPLWQSVLNNTGQPDL